MTHDANGLSFLAGRQAIGNSYLSTVVIVAQCDGHKQEGALPMDDEEEGSGIEVGDRVWWQRSEEVPGGILRPPARIFDPDKSYFKHPTVRYEGSVLSGQVRSIGFEEPAFSYATIATAPDGRILQAPLERLVKGLP